MEAGKKPIEFDVGKDEVKLRKALQRSRDLFGNDATLLQEVVTRAKTKLILVVTKEEGTDFKKYYARCQNTSQMLQTKGWLYLSIHMQI